MATRMPNGRPSTAKDVDGRLARVLEDVVRRRADGEPVPDEAVIRDHSDLMPQLAERLRLLRSLELAERRACLESGEPTAESNALDLPEDAFPGYRLLDLVDRGGQGVVYRAIQYGTQRHVAIKVVHEGTLGGSDGRSRFIREVRILAQLRHPNIVTIHDTGIANGRTYLVMDYIAGLPLDEYAAKRRLPVDEALRLFVKICDAVHAGHVKGVIHRDIKPSNIRVDEHGEPHVLDFGLAKLVSEDLVGTTQARAMTITGQFVGSLPWASPEQIRGLRDAVDVRVDVYALGAILFQMLTGRPPFPLDGGQHEAMRRILQHDPPYPSTLCDPIDSDLDVIVHKCLAKEPERRYQSAAALVDDVQRQLSGQPILARAPSTFYQVRKLVGRNPLVSALTASLFLLAVASAVWMGVLYAQASHERNRARQAEVTAEQEVRVAKAVNDFVLKEMLSAAGPNVSRGRDLRVADVLATASARVADSLEDQPLVEASVRMTIGAAYTTLGMFQEAMPHLREAQAIRSAQLGPDDSETIRASLELVRAMRDGRALTEADDLSAAVEEQCRRLFGEDDPLTLTAGFERAIVLYYLGRLEDSADLHWDTLERRRRVLGTTHSDTLASLDRWGYIGFLSRGRGPESEAIFRQAYDHTRRRLGEDHPTTIGMKVNLAGAIWAQRRFAEAEPLLTEACADTTRVLGQHHPSTIAALAWLAMMRREQDRTDEAEAMLRELIDLAEKSLGKDHPLTVETTNWLGGVLVRHGKYPEAQEVLKRVVKITTELTGPNSGQAAHAFDMLADTDMRLGHYRKAEVLLRDSLSIHRNVQPDDWCLRLLNLALAAQKKTEEARPIAEELLRLRRLAAERPDASAYQLNGCARELLEIYPVDLREPEKALDVARRAYELSDDNYHYNRYTLARAYEANGKMESAIDMMHRALAAAPLEDSAERSEYEATLARLYETVGRPDAAEGVYRDTLAARRERFPEGHPDIAESLFDLGTLLNRHAKHSEADSCLRECLSIRESLLQDPSSEPYRLTLTCQTAKTRAALSDTLMAQGHVANAGVFLQKAYESVSQAPYCHTALLPELLQRLIAVYELLGRETEVANYRAILEHAPVVNVE